MGQAFQASAEFWLAVDCCRRSFVRAGQLDAPLGLEGIDWERFAPLVRFHRIGGLARNGLKSDGSTIPYWVTQSLAAAAEENVVRNLQMTAECRELRDRFEAAGVPLLFLKGLTLGALAYGSPTPKAAIDIDLLVDPADLPKAASLLRGCGYR